MRCKHTLCVLLLIGLSACGSVDERSHDHDDAHQHEAGDGESPRTLLTHDERYQISYTPAPDPIPFNESFAVHIDIREATAPHALVTGATLVSVEGLMPSHGHGMNTDPSVESLGEGRFRADGMLFHMSGRWHLDVEVSGPSGGDTVSFHIDCCD